MEGVNVRHIEALKAECVRITEEVTPELAKKNCLHGLCLLFASASLSIGDHRLDVRVDSIGCIQPIQVPILVNAEH